MKRSIFLLGTVVMLAVSCSQKPEQIEISASVDAEVNEPKQVIAENKSEVDMEVKGMTCAMGCAKFIEEKVAGLNGVVLSQVNFEEKRAHFEFDKTQTSSKEIEQLINDIHDGIYEANIIDDHSTSSDELEETSNDEESLSSVRERLNISFPELFTYFIKRIR